MVRPDSSSGASTSIVFKNRKLNLYIPWLLGPFFGETPETYFVHHVGMHHVEENLEDDLSSTMPYKRWITGALAIAVESRVRQERRKEATELLTRLRKTGFREAGFMQRLRELGMQY